MKHTDALAQKPTTVQNIQDILDMRHDNPKAPEKLEGRAKKQMKLEDARKTLARLRERVDNAADIINKMRIRRDAPQALQRLDGSYTQMSTRLDRLEQMLSKLVQAGPSILVPHAAENEHHDLGHEHHEEWHDHLHDLHALTSHIDESLKENAHYLDNVHGQHHDLLGEAHGAVQHTLGELSHFQWPTPDHGNGIGL